jgi:hypothetical membrane protein
MKRIHLVFKYAGVAAIPAYVAFTILAHLHNPQINPIENWLSDYGSALVNPGGASFYNAGCVVAAVLLALFYIGMFRWYRRGKQARRFNISYALAQAGGLAGSVFLILTAVFTLGTAPTLHSTLSTANMIAMDCFISFTATGFLMNPQIPRAIGVFGFAASGFNVVTMNAFTDIYMSEWISPAFSCPHGSRSRASMTVSPPEQPTRRHRH